MKRDENNQLLQHLGDREWTVIRQNYHNLHTCTCVFETCISFFSPFSTHSGWNRLDLFQRWPLDLVVSHEG